VLSALVGDPWEAALLRMRLEKPAPPLHTGMARVLAHLFQPAAPAAGIPPTTKE